MYKQTWDRKKRSLSGKCMKKDAPPERLFLLIFCKKIFLYYREGGRPDIQEPFVKFFRRKAAAEISYDVF